MPRSHLPPAELAWWRSNWKQSINRVAPTIRRKIRKALGQNKLELAQTILWEALLRKNGLSMHQGTNHIVYVGDGGYSLDALRTGIATVETKNGKWANVRRLGTDNWDD